MFELTPQELLEFSIFNYQFVSSYNLTGSNTIKIYATIPLPILIIFIK